MQPRPATADEQEAAFRLLFQHCATEDRRQRTASGLSLLQQGELCPEGLFVLLEAGKVGGVILCLARPGAVGLVWPSQLSSDSGLGEPHQPLIHAALGYLRSHGVRVAQVMLEREELTQADPLLQAGFQHVTALWHLRHFLSLPTNVLTRPERCTLQNWNRVDQAVFRRALLQSYEGSLDCPELCGARSIDEIMIGHQAEPGFQPETCWLIREQEKPVGVILINDCPDEQGWEISYVGVVPEARRRGIGREIVTRALLEAKEAGVMQMTLAVDQRNTPAWSLYRELGFEAYDHREVLLCLLDSER